MHVKILQKTRHVKKNAALFGIVSKNRSVTLKLFDIDKCSLVLQLLLDLRKLQPIPRNDTCFYRLLVYTNREI